MYFGNLKQPHFFGPLPLIYIPSCRRNDLGECFNCCSLVTETLAECGVPYTHLFAMSPFRRRKRVRGSAQRNKGIEWIRNHPVPKNEKAIVFFADDDNTYDPRIFKDVSRYLRMYC